MPEVTRTESPTGVLYAPINLSAAGASTLVTGVAGKSIVVLSAWVICSQACNVSFETLTGGVLIAGPGYCIANGGFVLPMNSGGWFETQPGDSLLINLSPGVAVGGSLSYILV